MFEKLKEKLGGVKKVLGGAIEEKKEEVIETQPAEKEEIPAQPPETSTRAHERIGVFGRIKAAVIEREFIIDEKSLQDHLWELEMALLESDVALPVAEKIVDSVKAELVGSRRRIGSDTGKIVETALRQAILKVISVDSFDFDEFIKKSSKPVSIVFVGVNGTGKTTTIAKMAERFKEQGYSVVIAAGDTFRAGAIEQIEKHASALGVKIIKHQEGADPAAVVYDAIQFAKAKHKDIVLADTAGRMHTNINLMDQLKKIHRVNQPDFVIFVDEAVAGNDAVERAKLFNSAVAFNGSILTKQDADAKGGAAISISYSTGKPILFIGVGQSYKDLIKFDPEWLLDRLFE
ncbi:signal recognition particle-docking protein FtsY [Candidatus Methanoperedens nitroreducens]|uniref:Signal recognition particle receptor FtsY n=1 Tax=Candidatus Methanoperedens nitratireducens TaxID=1392998 RepID=A0A062V5X6_9EURY|nr:signal recognition particle-docking protein FtsY [Candidatus Methanoperedens nitroreducens]KCZ71209.1 signal recognition particle-docking protein FtsY [Candidatus Methanoperedens nitroreducens]MDJ1421410.1 signal recognition particle-docking protein FtsY [Candidatus Methanoperedens sp.]